VTIFTFEGIEFTVYISISTLRYDDFRLSTFELSKTPPFTIASTQQQQKKKLHNHVSRGNSSRVAAQSGDPRAS
jgi:hypothetical protein